MILSSAIMVVFAASPEGEDAAAATPAKKAGGTNDIYIVQMRAEPVATYRGGVSGLRATAPEPGRKIDQKSAEVMRYTDHLRAQHDTVINRVGAEKVYSYVYALNGFAARMNAKQAADVAKDPNVVSVDKDQAVSVDTSTTHRMLGLSAPGGLWEQLGGGNNRTNGPGENMVIGVVDTGIHPEHPSFKATDENGVPIYTPGVPDHTGTCQPTATDGSWNASFCNGKIVSAKKYNQGHGGDAGVAANLPWEFLSPRDWDGHGSHTASTAAGNFGITPNNNLVVHGAMSGMAPRARIAVYKACWETMNPAQGGCFFSDTSAAVDAATGDGVDAINYSIGGLNTFNNSVENAFRNAAAAGVFVSNSAGNDGPGASTVAKPGPWTINVANATHDRAQVAKLTLGNGLEFTGPSLNTSQAGPAPLIRAQDAGAASAPSADAVRLCFSATWNGTPGNPGPASLDPAKVQGKIVVCERGTNDRVDKSKAVQEAGGVGMVLVNVTANTLNADAHSVPSVHLDHNARGPIQTYAQTANASATISSSFVTTVAAPFISSSSSRGPINAAGGDILKPDVTGPGSDVLAAVAPPGNGGQTFALYSGTSMAAPHIAGVGMLLKQLHPTWSPMMIKSALMTTGINILDTGITEAVRIFAQGAGWIQPNNANNPGLVYDSNQSDWQAFLCAVGVNPGGGQAQCDALAAAGYDTKNPSNMNRASIAIGDLVGTETIKRRVTNVSNNTVTFTSSVTGLTGISAVVTPSSLTLAPGQTATFNVDFTRTSAAFNTYHGGYMTWTGGGHTVRIPIVARPLIITMPASASSNGSDIDIPMRFGYQGQFTAVPRGMIPATLTQGTVNDDPNDTDAWTPTTAGTAFFDFVVPAGTTYARFALFDANTDKPGLHDLDLHLYRAGSAAQLVESENATSNEEVNVVNPVADTYRVYVHGYNTSGPSASFTLFAWVLGNTGAGNMHVLAPWQATTGATASMHVEFTNLAPATKYLGTIAYSGQAGLPNPTVIRVDTPGSSAPPQLASVVSTRTHGALGERELVFPAGSMGVESRRGANYNSATGTGDYTVTFRFSAPISQGSATTTDGVGTISSKTQNGTDLVVNVTGVKNAQVLTFNITDVMDAQGNAAAPAEAQLRFLVGDVNGDLTVNAGDVTKVRSNSGNSADGAAIASDINCDGVVNSGDVTAVKNASGTSL